MGCGASSAAEHSVPTRVLTRAERIAAIKMVPVSRELEPKEIKAVENIFNAADVDKSRAIDDDELQKLLQSFGFALDRLSIEHISSFLRGESQPSGNPLVERKETEDKSKVDGSHKIDFNTFLKNWASLLKYCEDLSNAMQVPLVTNPNHKGLSFDTVLAPFVDAGFGDGIVLKGDVPKAIDKITSVCYEKGVLFNDSFFTPTPERVARSVNRNTYDKWVRISKLADDFTKLGGGTTTAAAETEKSPSRPFSIQSLLDSIVNSSFAKSFSASNNSTLQKETEPLMPLLFVQGTSSADVLNNQWGKNRFVAGIASLADRFDLLRNTIYPLHYNPAGIYGVRVQRGGEWFWIIVDDFIPVDKNSVPVYLRSKVINELWPLIIDKAFAKIKGSYEKVHNSPSLLLDPLYLLAGCQPATFLVPSSRDAPFPKRCEMVFSLIKIFMDHHWFVVASPSVADKESGLVLEHCYSVLGVIEASANDAENTEEHIAQLRKIKSDQSLQTSEKNANKNPANSKNITKNIQLVKCRNPWGAKEWEGKWSDNDPIWSKYPNLARINKFANNSSDDGVFWIQIDDLVSRFGTMHCWAVFDQSIISIINSRSKQKRLEALKSIIRTDRNNLHDEDLMGDENLIESDGEEEVADDDKTSPVPQQPNRPLVSYTSNHLLKSSKQQAIQQALPKSLAPFADSLQWLSMDTCWREAGVQLSQKRALQNEFTHTQKFLLTHQGHININGTPFMTPFDCPQFLISIPKTNAIGSHPNETLKSVTTSSKPSFERVTFYFRVRRLILGSKAKENKDSKRNLMKSEKSMFSEGNSDIESEESSGDEEENAALIREAISKATFPLHSDSDADHILTAGGFTSESSTARFLADPNVAVSAPQVFLVPSVPKPSTAAAISRFNMSLKGPLSVSTNPLHDNEHVKPDNNEADARERLMSIPTGKGIIAHSTGAYTRVSLPPGDYVLMVMVPDACEVPMKLVIRSRPKPASVDDYGERTSFSPLVVKSIRPCQGVVSTAELNVEALGEIIEQHTAFLASKEKEKEIMPIPGQKLGLSTTTTTTLGALAETGSTFNMSQTAAGSRFQIPTLQVANTHVTKETFSGNYIPTLPHEFTPVLAVTPSALTVKHVHIVAVTDRDFNFSKDRAGEFTVGTLKTDCKMLTTRTTVIKTDPSTKETTTVSGSYFDWRDISNDNQSSEEQQNATKIIGPNVDSTPVLADGGTGASSGRSGIAYATASSKTFGFYNLVTVRYLGAGHPFNILPFFTGDKLSNPNTKCVVALWSPEGKVALQPQQPTSQKNIT